MKAKLLVILFSAAVLTSCSNKKEAQTTDAADVQAETATVDLRGQWYLENIVLNDSVSVRPADVTPDVKQYITFEDSTFYIQTNCNSLQTIWKPKALFVKYCPTLLRLTYITILLHAFVAAHLLNASCLSKQTKQNKQASTTRILQLQILTTYKSKNVPSANVL